MLSNLHSPAAAWYCGPTVNTTISSSKWRTAAVAYRRVQETCSNRRTAKENKIERVSVSGSQSRARLHGHTAATFQCETYPARGARSQFGFPWPPKTCPSRPPSPNADREQPARAARSKAAASPYLKSRSALARCACYCECSPGCAQRLEPPGGPTAWHPATRVAEVEFRPYAALSCR